MSKAEMPVSHIIAIVLGVIVLAILGYLIYTNFIKVDVTILEETCKGKLTQYCTFWSICNYEPTEYREGRVIQGCQPNDADFYDEKNSKDCLSLKEKLSGGVDVTSDICKNLLRRT